MSDWRTDPTQLSPRSKRLLWSTFVGLVLACIIALIPLPYAILRPGPATNTLGTTSDGKPLVDIKGASTYPTSGGLDFTTVRVSGGPGRRVNAWDLLGAWMNPHDEIFREDQLFPKGSTSKQIEEQNAAEMAGSQSEAAAIALRSLGKKVGESYVVAALTEGAPSASVLKVGDVITAVDGRPVTALIDIQNQVRTHQPGDSVEVTVSREGSSQTVTTTTIAADGRPVLGVRLRMDFDFPFEVTIHAGDVGGPSAGTMFALAIRDVLTPGEMTGGKQIAGTGTIDDDGIVGPIGGIRQKIVGAKEAGATFFLAPADNCAELVGHVPDGITAVKIATFDQAVSAVEKIAAGQGDLSSCG